MSSDPLVSVCVSAYNNEDVLMETIDSILAQTYPNLELVLRDDGSSDGTANVIRAIDDERVRSIVSSPNLGGYESMNHLISLARGELIAIYHSDDVYDSTIVAREVEFLVRHPEAGAVFTLDRYIGDDGSVVGQTTLPDGLRGHDLVTYEDLLPHVLRRKNTFLRCPTFMTRRHVLDDVGPFEPETWASGSDLELWLRLSRRYPIGIIDEHLMSYRVRRDSWTASYERLRTEEERFFSIMDHYLALDRWHERLRTDDIREYSFHRCEDQTQRAASHVLRGELAEARSLLRHRYSISTYVRNARRRKLRIVVMRTAMRAGLTLRATRLLSRLLLALQYRGRLA